MVFGGSQVLMDIEPLIGMMRGSAILHGYTHTLAGALGIGAAAALIGKPISSHVLRHIRAPHHPLTWRAAALAAFVGTFSHIIFDAVMHRDIRPWWPFSSTNGLLHAIPVDDLHYVFVALGAIGTMVMGAGWLRSRA
jgi:membrane-bound metal-dependent hydrolase YbcI (DUF457 family)